MKIVCIMGGLGNQMFQYAFYKSLVEAFGYQQTMIDLSSYSNYQRYNHNGYELFRVFGINAPIAPQNEIYRLGDFKKDFFSKVKRRFGGKGTHIKEFETGKFQHNIYIDNADRYYSGYWQSESYFINVSDSLRHDFTFIDDLKDKNTNIVKEILSSNAISIHVRRGDYLNLSEIHPTCNFQYYQKAIHEIERNIDNPHYFIFSDDIEWCQMHFGFLERKNYIDWNKGQNSYIDMHLMSLCKHNIIANSSFSWWAAWLNNNLTKIVIAPEKWFGITTNNIALSSWIKI